MINLKFKMNRIFSFVIFTLLLQCLPGCTSDAMPECYRTAGAIVTYDAEVDPFTSVVLSEGIALVITQGDEQRVTIETPENFKPEISAETINGELHLRNNTSCNWVRDYNMTTVYLTTPNLESIYSASQFEVKSNGVLAFPTLTLQSGLHRKTASGTWVLNVNCQTLVIEDNQSSFYNISGNADNLAVSFYAGDSRFDGTNLISQNLEVFHRSSNDIIANVAKQATGTIYSTGNLVLVNHPEIIDIDQLFHGAVKYQ